MNTPRLLFATAAVITTLALSLYTHHQSGQHLTTPHASPTAPPAPITTANSVTPKAPLPQPPKAAPLPTPTTTASTTANALLTFVDHNTIDIHLPGQERHRLKLTHHNQAQTMGTTYQGKLDGIDNSEGIITIVQGELSAFFHIPGATDLRVRPTGNGNCVVEEIDNKLEPACTAQYAPLATDKNPARAPDENAGASNPGSASGVHPHSASASAPRIDMLVLYTTAARISGGKQAAIAAQISQSITEINACYQNSQIDVTVNLVGTAEVAYTESGDSAVDLNRITEPADGYLDQVAALRTAYQADVVMLVVSNLTDGTLGISYVMPNPSTRMRDYAFIVTSLKALTGYYVPAHELGHICGCAHDLNNATPGGIFNYSYGYRFWTLIPTAVAGIYSYTEVRTVMAYAPGARIPYFSNPQIYYGSVATGAYPATGRAFDNSRTINETAGYVASFMGTTSVIELNTNHITVTEAKTTLSFPLTRQGRTDLPATVRVYAPNFTNTTDSHNAIAGVDYTRLDTNITFAANVTNATLRFGLLDDTLPEPAKSVTLYLEPLTNCTLGMHRSVTIDIVDNEPTTIALTPNGNLVTSDNTTLTFTVERLGLTNNVSVNYKTTDGTARANVDYTPISGTINIPASACKSLLTLPIYRLPNEFSDRTFTLSLNTPSNAKLAAQTSAAVTIQNLVSTYAFTTNSYSVTDQAYNISIRIIRTGETNSAPQLSYKSTPITPLSYAWSPFSYGDGTIEFAPGQTETNITINIRNTFHALSNWGAGQSPETQSFQVSLSPRRGNISIGNCSNTIVTVYNTETLIGFKEHYLEITNNGTTLQLPVIRQYATNRPLNVGIWCNENYSQAQALTDYTITNPNLYFAPGQTQTILTVAIPFAKPGTPARCFQLNFSAEPYCTLGTSNGFYDTLNIRLARIPGPQPTLSLRLGLDPTSQLTLFITSSHNQLADIWTTPTLPTNHNSWDYLDSQYVIPGENAYSLKNYQLKYGHSNSFFHAFSHDAF